MSIIDAKLKFSSKRTIYRLIDNRWTRARTRTLIDRYAHFSDWIQMQKIPNYVHIDIFVSRLQKPVNHLNCITIFFFCMFACVFFHFILFLSFFFLSFVYSLCYRFFVIHDYIEFYGIFKWNISRSIKFMCWNANMYSVFAVCCVLSMLLKSFRILYIEYWIVYNIGINHGFSTSS